MKPNPIADRRPAKATQKRKLTAAQKDFAEAKVLGLNDRQAALSAGLTAAPTTESVRVQIETARRWLTDITQIKRLDVIEGLIDGIEMARMLGDPGNVIKGWVEVGKFLGYAAPEQKNINLTVSQMQLQSKIAAMSVEDLLAVAEGTYTALNTPNRQITVDG